MLSKALTVGALHIETRRHFIILYALSKKICLPERKARKKKEKVEAKRVERERTL